MEQLPFDQHYIRHFVNHLLRDTDFLQNVWRDVKPELFSDTHYQMIVRLIQNFRLEHGAAPGTLIYRVLDSWKDSGTISAPVHTSLVAVLETLFELPLQNKSFLLDQFSK